MIVPIFQFAGSGGSSIPVLPEESQFFEPSININGEADVFMPFFPELSLSSRLGYKFTGFFANSSSLSSSTIDLTAGPRVTFFINEMFEMSVFARAGGFWSLVHGGTYYDINASINAGLNGRVKFLDNLGMDLNLGYRSDFTVEQGQFFVESGFTYQMLSKRILSYLHFKASTKDQVPVLQFDNYRDLDVTNIEVSIVFKEKWIKPVVLKSVEVLGAGKASESTVIQQLPDEIFQLYRGKVAKASFKVKYKANGNSFTAKIPVEISFKPEILLPAIQKEVDAAQQRIYMTGATPQNRNKLAVVYAHYGLYDEAESIFTQIVATNEYVPTLVNMGNMFMLKENYFRAIPYFERAREKAPYNTEVLISLAKAHVSVENFGSAKSIYDVLEAINPDLAKEYSWFKLSGDSARKAADADKKKTIVKWLE